MNYSSKPNPFFLYKEKDATFRGFRHSPGQLSGTGDKSNIKFKAKAITIEGNEVMDGFVNWESSQTGDSERFSQEANGTKRNKTVKSFDVYLKRKEIRDIAKKTARVKVANLEKKIPGKEL